MIEGPTISEDLLFAIKATRKFSSSKNVRILANLLVSIVMEKFVGLCYQVTKLKMRQLLCCNVFRLIILHVSSVDDRLCNLIWKSVVV